MEFKYRKTAEVFVIPPLNVLMNLIPLNTTKLYVLRFSKSVSPVFSFTDGSCEPKWLLEFSTGRTTGAFEVYSMSPPDWTGSVRRVSSVRYLGGQNQT